MVRTYKLIFKTLLKNDIMLLLNIAMYSTFYAIHPYLMTILPEIVIEKIKNGDGMTFISTVLLIGISAAFSQASSTFLYNNAWMRMNKLRFIILGDLIDASLGIPYYESLNPSYLDKVEKARNATMNPSIGIGSILSNSYSFLGNFFASIAVFSIVSSLSLYFSLLVLVSIIVIFYLSQKQIKLEDIEWEKSNQIKRKAERLYDIATDETYGMDMRMYNLGKLIDTYGDNFFSNYRSLKLKTIKGVFNTQVLINIIEMVQNIFVYGWIVLNLINGRLNVGSFLMYVIGVNQLTSLVKTLLSTRNNIKKETKRFSSFFDILDMFNICSNSVIETQIENDKIENYEIRFENVTFAYPESNVPIFSDFNLTIKKRERVALIGVNGSGKSTLIKLLCRLFQPQKGRILINNKDITQIPLDKYYELIKVIFQDGKIFPFSIKENITLNNDKLETKYKEAISISNFDEIISRLSKKDDTYLYHIMESDGIDLSGGEKQKLLLARATYKKAPIFLLDEPSGAMDALTEESIYNNYNRLTKGNTSIIISHKLTFVRFCDRIILIEKGKIVEEGTHHDLLKKDGQYATMYKLQANQY